MGLSGISIPQLLIILAIIVLLFGSKRLGSLGSDLGGAIKGFRRSLNSDDEPDQSPSPSSASEQKPGSETNGNNR